MATKVSVILAGKGDTVYTVTPDKTIREVVSALAEHNVGALVVRGDEPGVSGIVSERDIVRCLASEGAESLERPVTDAMSAEVTTCNPGTTTDELMELMTAGRFRHIPVLEDGELVGIVSIGDAVKSRMDELETRAESLEEYVTGSSY